MRSVYFSKNILSPIADLLADKSAHETGITIFAGKPAADIRVDDKINPRYPAFN